MYTGQWAQSVLIEVLFACFARVAIRDSVACATLWLADLHICQIPSQPRNSSAKNAAHMFTIFGKRNRENKYRLGRQGESARVLSLMVVALKHF